MDAENFAKDHLKAFVERIERLEEEKKELAGDIRDVYAEAKATGFDVPALRAIIKLRKQDADKRREHEAILETYMHALGMLADLPLGQAAIEAAGATISLTNPKLMPSGKAVKASADRAEARARELA